MKIYVGYILGDYAHAVFMSASKQKVEKALNECPTRNYKWVEEYNIKDDTLFELDCD